MPNIVIKPARNGGVPLVEFTGSIGDSRIEVGSESDLSFVGAPSRFLSGLSGSLQSLATGESYLVAGSGITISTSSASPAGQVTIASTITQVSPGGLDTHVQYNDGSVFGGDGTFTFNKNTDTLNVQNVIVAGDFTVNGTMTTVNSTNLEVKDSVVGLGFASGTIAQSAGDRGLIGGLANTSNVAMLWKHATAEFVLGRTTSSATGSFDVDSYGNLHVANIQADIVTASLGFTGSLTKLTNGQDYLRAGGGISLTTGALGDVTIAATVAPGSPPDSVQFNSAGAFAGDSTLTFNAGTKMLTAQDITTTGDLAVNGGDITTSAAIFNIGNTSTNTQIANLATAATTTGNVKTVNLGTGGVSDSTTNVNIAATGSSGRTTIRSPNITLSGSVEIVPQGGGGAQLTTTSGDFSIGNPQPNGSWNLNLGTAPSAGLTKTINLGTGGASNSSTVVNVGSNSSINNSVKLMGQTIDVGRLNQGATYLLNSTTFASGTIVAAGGLSGSLQRLSDGSPYLLAGSGITISTGSISPVGQVTISSTTGLDYIKTFSAGSALNPITIPDIVFTRQDVNSELIVDGFGRALYPPVPNPDLGVNVKLTLISSDNTQYELVNSMVTYDQTSGVDSYIRIRCSTRLIGASYAISQSKLEITNATATSIISSKDSFVSATSSNLFLQPVTYRITWTGVDVANSAVFSATARLINQNSQITL